jgi:TolA-binding protein/HAMP domain-containing protein
MRATTIAAILIALAPAAHAVSAMKLKPAPKDIDSANTGPAHFKAPTSEDDVARDVAADRKRDELIEELKTIIPRIPESERKADLYFQLAELWWEKSRYVSLQEVKKYDDAYAAWSQVSKDRKTAAPEPKVSTRESDAYRKEALKLYQTILKNYPSYPRKDEVLFVVAYNLYESGSKAEAIQNYNTLIKQYPNSRFVPDAYVQMGEHYFTTNDLARARAAFEKAAAFKLPKLYSFAIYKLAWCDYNAQEYNDAIAKFKDVINYSEQQQEKQGSRDRIQLKNEALKDIVLAYAQIDAIDSATSYLREKGGAHALDYVNKLAATFFDTGKFDQAIRVYKALEAEAPTHVRAPAWQQKILLAYDKLNKRDRVVAEMKVLVKDYGPQSAWAKANADQKGAIAEANDLAESALRELVQDYHQEAIKTKSVATYKLARDIYKQYLETFPESETAYSMRFYYAEILYALEDWDAAAEQYEKVVDSDLKGQYAQKAAYDTILALEKSVGIAKGKLKKHELADETRIDERKAKGQVEQNRVIKLEKLTKETEEQPIPENEQKLIAACEKYLTVAGHSKDEIVIRYKAAFVYYDHRHYVEAANRFGDIILKWPNDAWSQKAADLSLDILNTKEAWLDLSELAHKFHEDRRLAPAGSEFEKRVAKLGENAKFKYVQLDLYEKKKDYPLAAQQFREFVQQYPHSENAPKALYNALLIADKADQLDLEIAAGAQLLKDYPRAEEGTLKLTIPALANAYERSARYPEAIKWYEEAQSRWPADAKAPDWLFNAAVWREGMADDAGALADWQKYVKQYGTRPDAAKIAFNIGLILERQKDYRKISDYWYGFQREWARAATPGQLLLARYKEGMAMREQRASDPNVPIVMAEVAQKFRALPDSEKLPKVADAAAHARFMNIDNAFDEFQKIHFNYTRQADLVYVLKIKNARLTKLLDAYTEVIKFGSPRWSEAALERLGEAYRNFNKGLLDAPMPRGLDPEQQDLYRTTLENQALPLEDKATDAFEKAVQTGQKTQVYSEWVVKAQDFLHDYKPDEYGDVHKPALVDSDSSKAVAPDLSPKSGSGGY